MDIITENKARVAAYIAAHPELTLRVVAAKLNMAESTLSLLARNHGIHRKPRLMATLDLSALEDCECKSCEEDSLAGCCNNATVEKNGLHLCAGCAASTGKVWVVDDESEQVEGRPWTEEVE